MELLRALGALIEDPAPQHRRIARELGLPRPPPASVHGAVVGFQRFPYASVHLGPEGMMGGEARDRIAGFRRALGLDRADDGIGTSGPSRGDDRLGASGPDQVDDRPAAAVAGAAEPDHLAALLALAAALERWRRDHPDPARQALLREAAATLAWEHVLSWTGPYLASFDRCGSPFHEAWAALLARALDELAGRLELGGGRERATGSGAAHGLERPQGSGTGRPHGHPRGSGPDRPHGPQHRLPAALRASPPLADPRRDGGPAFLAALLAPVRSGAILLRDDLVRLGEEAGLACRAGERRYALEAFLAQDPRATLEWLAGHAHAWSGRVARRGPAPIAGWWSERAASSAALLRELARGAAAMERAGNATPSGARASSPVADAPPPVARASP